MRPGPNRAAPPVPPLPDDTPRPRWSVMIPTWNSGAYLRRTLESVLTQAPGPEAMQIEVVDDASTRDDPARLVRAVGAGRIAFHRQPRNVGPISNFNTCIARARGEWLHILHGDDLVRPGFYDALGAGLAGRPDVGAAFCRCSVIDAEERETWLYELERADAGVLDDFVARIAVWARIQTPTIVVRRAVYEALGGYDVRLAHTADWEMWQRIAVRSAIWYEPRALACYRVHGASDTSRLVRTAANVADIRRAIAIAHTYLPPHRRDELRRRALAFSGESAVGTARRLRSEGDPDAALAQLRAAMGCLRDAGRLSRAARVGATALALWARRRLGVEGGRAAANG